jgi:hypothetical protein
MDHGLSYRLRSPEVGHDDPMTRTSRSAVALALLMTVAACGDEGTKTADPPPISAAPPSAVPSDPPSTPVDDGESAYVEEEPDPTPASGDLPDEAQSFLDQALDTELNVLTTAGTAAAEKKLGQLGDLPEDPRQVLKKLATYTWQSAQAKALYEKAVSASGVTQSAGR